MTVDKVPGKHRFVFDTTSPDGFATGSLRPTFSKEQNVVWAVGQRLAIVARHKSTAFGYNDAIWAKYSVPLGSGEQFRESRDESRPGRQHLRNAWCEWRPSRPARRALKRGVHLGVAEMATDDRRCTGPRHQRVMTTNWPPTCCQRASGSCRIVAVNRAQRVSHSSLPDARSS
jgi:hypothetical protein